MGEKREAPEAGEIFVQKDLLETLTKMVQAEDDALKKGKKRKEAIMAAYDRFYKLKVVFPETFEALIRKPGTKG